MESGHSERLRQGDARGAGGSTTSGGVSDWTEPDLYEQWMVVTFGSIARPAGVFVEMNDGFAALEDSPWSIRADEWNSLGMGSRRREGSVDWTATRRPPASGVHEVVVTLEPTDAGRPSALITWIWDPDPARQYLLAWETYLIGSLSSLRAAMLVRTPIRDRFTHSVTLHVGDSNFLVIKRA